MRLRTDNRELRTSSVRNSSRGYILITLLLFMTLIAMAALAVLPDMVQQVKRDREEEMVHRGTEYMRAIKKYNKKFGRYPSRIEELENTNQQRFLRKRYKDPMGKGNQEFKLVHVGDPLLNNLGMGGIGVGQGLNPNPGPGTGPRPGQLLGQTGNQPNFVAAAGGGVRPAGPDDANTPQVTGLPGQQGPGTNTPPGSDSENAETAVDAKSSGDSLGGQVFGGGPIVGVASTSKAKSIRVFNKKDHYNEWVFIYDPRLDRAGALLQGPVQPDATSGMGMGMNPGGAIPGQGAMSPQPTGQPKPQQQQPEPPDEQ